MQCWPPAEEGDVTSAEERESAGACCQGCRLARWMLPGCWLGSVVIAGGCTCGWVPAG
jgi:hypothetical protein